MPELAPQFTPPTAPPPPSGPAVSPPVIRPEEFEDYRVELDDVAAFELTIIPNLSGGSYASLAQLRLA